MKIIDGKHVANILKQQIAKEVSHWISLGNRAPHLAAVLVGGDGASETYVAAKEKACQEVGFQSTIIKLPATISQSDLIDQIEKLNNDSNIDGFIVQLPLPKHITEHTVIEAINPAKDVDGFHPINVGRMSIGLPSYISATPAGILELFKFYEIETQGKKCVIIGRSNIVGKPMASLMSQKGYPGDCTVTVCHSKSENIKEICKKADIIIAALGIPKFLTAEYVQDNVVIIDVGITREPSQTTKSGWQLVGDVDFQDVAPHCDYITPVPGGVGPMTIVALMQNTLKAARKEIYK